MVIRIPHFSYIGNLSQGLVFSKKPFIKGISISTQWSGYPTIRINSWRNGILDYDPGR